MSQAPETTPQAPLNRPGLKLSLLTHRSACCPSCGFDLDGRATILVSADAPAYQHEITIGAVCAICYRDRYADVLQSVRLLFHPVLTPHCEIVHGIRFFSPGDPTLIGHPASIVLDHLSHNRELPTIPHVELTMPIEQCPDEPTLFDQCSQPLTDSPEAYDPACPADVRDDHDLNSRDLRTS